MNRKYFQYAIGLLWLVLPLTAIRYWMAWAHLPPLVATHFDEAGHPNGWMTRETSLIFGLGITLFLLVILTVLLYVIEKKNTGDTFSWAFLGFCYVMIGFIYYGNASIVSYNLYGKPVEVAPVPIVVPLAVIALVAVYLGSKRGQPLQTRAWLAQEVHASKLWAAVFLIPLVIELAALIAVPLVQVRLGLTLLCLVFVVVVAQAWSGFLYKFGPSGVEISTLGFRLRSIPREQIKAYTAKHWTPLRGYGIRGVGHKRAYVWGNRGVLIKTSDGEVFLGHSQPERVIRDLDTIMKYAH
jgi:hypothetical protein